MARPIERIDTVLNLLREVWLLHPDQRFGQLVMNAGRNSSGRTQDVWEIEDTEWIGRLNEAALGNWPGDNAMIEGAETFFRRGWKYRNHPKFGKELRGYLRELIEIMRELKTARRPS